MPKAAEAISMKVAIIRRKIHPYGGVEGYGLRLIHGLKKKGLEVGVLAEEYQPEEGVKFYPVKSDHLSLGLSPLTFNRNCQEILKREKFDLVHSLERTWPQDIYRAGEGCHREFMKTLSIKHRLSPKHLITLYTEKRAFFSSQYIMANSERVKREIIVHYGIPEDKIVVIYTGVDIERFTPPQRTGAKSSPLNEELTILFIGSGFRRKGLDLLIRALAQVDRSLRGQIPKQSQVKLLVAGGGNFDRYLKLANSLGLEGKVKFLGLVKDIDSLYARADLLVLPSLYEPFSNTCLEAMACGIPALTTRCNGVSEILGGDLRDLIIEDPFDIDEMANKIKTLISKDMRQSLSLKVREAAQKFSFSWHLEEILKLYELVLRNRKIKEE